MSKKDIETSVLASLDEYFNDLQGEKPHNLHNMIIQAAEKPLLEAVLQRTRNNQSVAAQWLGINRNTLRKKLAEHQLLELSHSTVV